MKRLHFLLTASSLSLIALSINRLTGLTSGYIGSNQFLRWVDLNAMLFIPLAIIIIYYLLKKYVEQTGTLRYVPWVLWLNLLFVGGVYLFGVSSGDHETANYLHGRFCDAAGSLSHLCGILAYHDDTFSHLLYYTGLTCLTVALLGTQVIYPSKHKTSGKDLVLLGMNALVIALAVFANIAFEPAAIDMVAFGLLAVISGGTLLLLRKQFRDYPVIFYLALAYGTGIIATSVYKMI